MRLPVVTASEMKQRRSPSALRAFVVGLKESVGANDSERHRANQKEELYKEFLDEIVPLSRFSMLAYPENYEIQPVLGNQGYDALVFNETGQEVDRVEITTPHDGWAQAQDAKLLATQGYGKLHLGDFNDGLRALLEHVLSTCRKKAQKDYSGCTLVVAIDLCDFQIHDKLFEVNYEKQIEMLTDEMTRIKFKTKRVFLLVLPDRLMPIQGGLA